MLPQRFALGLLMLAALVLASPPCIADEAEDKAAAFVEKKGGVAIRDPSKSGKPVIIVNLSDCSVADADVKGLAALKMLGTLDLRNNRKKTDASLKDLAGLSELKSLDLTNTGVT